MDSDNPEKKAAKAAAKACAGCEKSFALRKKHYCNNCKKVFCEKCARFERPIIALGIKEAVRVCSTCNESLNVSEGESSTKMKSVARQLALKMEKKVAGSIATAGNSSITKSLMDDDMTNLFDALHDFITKCSGEEEADAINKCIIKIIVKTAVLDRNKELTPDDLKTAAQLRGKLKSLFLTIISFHEVAFTYDFGFIENTFKEIEALVLKIVERHLTEKSAGKVTRVFSFLKERQHLDKLYNDKDFEDIRTRLAVSFQVIVDKQLL